VKRALLVTAKGRWAPASVARLSCPGRGAALPQRCTAEPGPITPAPRLLGPGSAAHHSANAPCCAAHGTRYRHDFAFSRRDFARV